MEKKEEENLADASDTQPQTFSSVQKQNLNELFDQIITNMSIDFTNSEMLDIQAAGANSSCSESTRYLQHRTSFVEIGHETISTAIFPLPLIQVGQLSVMAKGCALNTG